MLLLDLLMLLLLQVARQRRHLHLHRLGVGLRLLLRVECRRRRLMVLLLLWRRKRQARRLVGHLHLLLQHLLLLLEQLHALLVLVRVVRLHFCWSAGRDRGRARGAGGAAESRSPPCRGERARKPARAPGARAAPPRARPAP